MTLAPSLPAMQTVSVDLGARGYDIHIGAGMIDQAGRLCAPYLRKNRAIIVTDAHVDAAWGPALRRSLQIAGYAPHMIVLEPGEARKSWAGLEALCSQLLDLNLDRKEALIALGGGVIGDLAGFAASILKRGAPFIQIPTSLLAQVDSSVGGKTAIDTPQGKNLIGAFHQPSLVLADVAVLDTLPERELRAGYAETVKYAAICDAPFFDWLEHHGADVLAGVRDAQTHAVKRSIEWKAQIVAEDEREQGRRALLNLGHTFAHALEAEAGYDGRINHGEAVAWGMAMALRYSTRLGLCPPQDAQRLHTHWRAVGLPSLWQDLPKVETSPAALLERMHSDKKAEDGRLTLILARGLGQAFVEKHAQSAPLLDFLTEELGA